MNILDFYINPRAISVFSKTTCGFCSKAKTLLENEYPTTTVQFIDIDNMEQGMSIGMELRQKTGQTTVPNIFVFGKHIGGYNELKQLHDHGTLRKLIFEQTNVYRCDFCGKDSPTKNLSCNCFYSCFDEWGSPN
tara:strand:+ start:2171 stop:2572 length:402 start_codon:yes stop_codon:yes gene_type:complete